LARPPRPHRRLAPFHRCIRADRCRPARAARWIYRRPRSRLFVAAGSADVHRAHLPRPGGAPRGARGPPPGRSGRPRAMHSVRASASGAIRDALRFRRPLSRDATDDARSAAAAHCGAATEATLSRRFRLRCHSRLQLLARRVSPLCEPIGRADHFLRGGRRRGIPPRRRRSRGSARGRTRFSSHAFPTGPRGFEPSVHQNRVDVGQRVGDEQDPSSRNA